MLRLGYEKALGSLVKSVLDCPSLSRLRQADFAPAYVQRSGPHPWRRFSTEIGDKSATDAAKSETDVPDGEVKPDVNDMHSGGDEAAASEGEQLLDQLQADVDIRTTELEAARKEAQEMRERSLRALADLENLRTRSAQQLDASRQFAIQGFAKSVLDVADNLERALSSVPEALLKAEGDGESGEHVDAATYARNLRSLHNGVAMSEKIMLKIFRDNGLARLEVKIGDEFDPNSQNAMFEVPTKDVEPGRIAAIVKKGYTLHGRVIRAADVGVAQRPVDDMPGGD